ncbi:hypothetical protein PS862_04480 [Pseudomonas fluorescens]|uniref:Acyl-[acyl-carrier-protein] dehydrogenase MbtN n=2 Tax=Pseudomonas fluorescens TaxID=294 RepID=A0A5E7N8Z7_PSEFL|nr:hypothetical protein PS862_04480 [Pseudomonas fluorescens]
MIRVTGWQVHPSLFTLCDEQSPIIVHALLLGYLPPLWGWLSVNPLSCKDCIDTRVRVRPVSLCNRAVAKGYRMDVQRSIYREDHEMFRTAVRRFLEREYLPRRAQWEPGGALDRRLWLKAGREGLLCVTLPAQFGGGGDFGHAAVLSEEFARAGVRDRALSLHSDTLAPCIASLGDDVQSQRWLPGICSGETILALAVAEPASSLENDPTRAVRDGGHYLINGSKACVGNGMQCDMVLLACHIQGDDGAGGLSLVIVELDRPGVYRVSHDAEQPTAAELHLVNVRVPVGNLLGEAGRGQEYLDEVWSQEHQLSAIFSASQLEQLLLQTLAWVQLPDGAGHALWGQADIRRTLAGIKIRAVALRLLVDHYLERRMRQSLSNEQTAIASLYASETLGQCIEEIAHLHRAGDRQSSLHGQRANGSVTHLHEFIARAL